MIPTVFKRSKNDLFPPVIDTHFPDPLYAAVVRQLTND